MTTTTTSFAGQLLPRQREGVTFLLKNPRCLVSDEVGTDRAAIAAALIGALADRGDLHLPPIEPDPGYAIRHATTLRPLPVLWVTDASQVPRTVAELRRVLPTFATLPALTGVAGDRADREQMAALLAEHPEGPDVVVTTPGVIDNRHEHYEALQPRVVVVDDAWALKAAGTRHRALTYVSEASERVVAMTSKSPRAMPPKALWALLALIAAPGLLPFEEFSERYVTWTRTGYGKKDLWRSREDRAEALSWASAHILDRTAAVEPPQLAASG